MYRIFTSEMIRGYSKFEWLVDITAYGRDPRVWTALAPTWDMVREYKRGGNTTVYKAAFYDKVIKYLNGHDDGSAKSENIYNACKNIHSLLIRYGHVVFMCYCPPYEFCHRRLVSESLPNYMKTHFNIDVIYKGERIFKPGFYTGVGSRKTPEKIKHLMSAIAIYLESIGKVLRTGDAVGADGSFRTPAHNKEVYKANDATSKSIEMAAEYHPVFNTLGEYARKLHGRNSFQVLGRELDMPSELLVCWTPDGATTHAERSRDTGGTGTAISIADKETAGYTRIYNLSRDDHRLLWENVLNRR